MTTKRREVYGVIFFIFTLKIFTTDVTICLFYILYNSQTIKGVRTQKITCTNKILQDYPHLHKNQSKTSKINWTVRYDRHCVIEGVKLLHQDFKLIPSVHCLLTPL